MKNNRALIQYLKQTIIWLEEKNPKEPNNEVKLLNIVRELQAIDPLLLVITVERLEHIARNTQRDAKPSWNNPLFHWTQYKAWGLKICQLLYPEKYGKSIQKVTQRG